MIVELKKKNNRIVGKGKIYLKNRGTSSSNNSYHTNFTFHSL